MEGYRIQLPEERLSASFNDESILELTPDLVGPSTTQNSGIIGETVNMDLSTAAITREFIGERRIGETWEPSPPLILAAW